MRIARVKVGRRASFAVIEGETAALLAGKPFRRIAKTGETAPLSSLRLLAPVKPSKIVCVGLNYADHAAETGAALPDEPCLFMKPSTAVIGPGDAIVYPKMSARVDYEAELAVVIGRKARNVRAKRWQDYVFGYTVLNDVTARDLQAKDGQWTRAKGFDTFAPIGLWIETEIDPSDLRVTAHVNGVIKQDSRTSKLIFPPAFLVPFMSRIMTLLPGDVIATGTPAGISGMSVGDTVEIEVEGIGVLSNTIVAGKAR